MPTPETVLCLPAETCRRLFRDGFTPNTDTPLESLDRAGEWHFLPRDEAETDETRRHLITYTVLRSQGKVFTYRRGASGSEGRLHGRLSIGVGGHVNQEDMISTAPTFALVSWEQLIQAAAFREVDEEMSLTRLEPTTFLGWLCSSSTPVNRVHLGAVFALDLPEPVHAREDCLADGRWLTPAELLREVGELEDWSRILVEAGAQWLGMPDPPEPMKRIVLKWMEFKDGTQTYLAKLADPSMPASESQPRGDASLSVLEAIGSLVAAHPERFGVAIERERAGRD